MTTAPPAGTAAGTEPLLAERLGALRTKYFVGRAAELEVFRSALRGGERRPALLYVHGPGGVGKSMLLREFGRVATAAGASVVPLDGRDLEPSPAGFLRGLGQASRGPRAS